MQAGDIVFVRPAADDLTGQFIARATDGPYSHVRIAISSQEVVEALTRGITRSFVTVPPDAADVAAAGAHLQVDSRARALAWLIRQVNRPYGFGSIAADVVRFVLPQAWGGRTPFLVWPRRYDCSELATRFLDHANYKWLPDDMVDQPETVSPNDLARALGVLKA